MDETVKNLISSRGYHFEYVPCILPDKDETGEIRKFEPQCRYKNTHKLRLHKHGRGPFCRFRISRSLNTEGTYLLIVNGVVQYVGECKNLSSRFNSGYGQISPRNCFCGGQITNCKINQLILKAAEDGNQIELWFFKNQNRKEVEEELIANLNPPPPWND